MPLTFSSGPHNCLGQALATAEIAEVVGMLARRYPEATIVESETSVGQAGGRWLIDKLTLNLRG